MFLKRYHRWRWMAVMVSLLWSGLFPVFAANNDSQPQVVVSIKPLHSLVAGVMQGVAAPTLIVKGNASPHTYRLKPSDARAIQAASAIFWAGDNVETFLIKPLKSLPRHAKVVALSMAPGIRLLPVRGGGQWQSDHEHEHGDHVDHDEEQTGGAGLLHNADPHVWLDPVNAEMMLKTIVKTLSEVDSMHAAQYQHNGERIKARLQRLNQSLMTALTPVSRKPFMVFHDAYQYLEKRYHLTAVGSVVFQMNQSSSARRLRRLHKLIHSSEVSCVFSEPEFSPKKINALIRGTRIKTAVLDPLGSALAPGPDLYFSLMTDIKKSILSCLGQ